MRLSGCIILMANILVACGNELTDLDYVERAKSYQDSGDLSASIVELKNALRVNSKNSEARWYLGNIYLEYGDGASAEKELRHAGELGVSVDAVKVPITKAMLLQGQYDVLLDETDDLENFAPDVKASLHAFRGDAYLGMRKPDSAVIEYTAALSISNDLPEADIGLARIALIENRTEDARALISKVQSKMPDMQQAWRLLGDIERSLGNFDEAEEAYGKAIEFGLDNKNDHLSRALMRILQENHEGAEKDIGAAKAIAGEFPRARYIQGLLYFYQNKFQESEIEFEKVMQVMPEYLPLYFYLGVAQFRLGKHEQASYSLEKYLSAVPESDQARILLSFLYMKQNKPAKSINILEAVLSEKPDDVIVLRLLGNIYLSVGQLEKGVDYLEKALELQPEASEGYMELGLKLMDFGMAQEGLSKLEMAFVLDPEEKTLESQLVLAYLQNRKFEKAINMAIRMKEEDPDDPAPLDFLALAYLGMSDRVKAESYFHQALKVSPGDPIAGLSLASQKAETGDIDEARKLYKEVLEHNPNHQQALVRLARLEVRQGDPGKVEGLLKKVLSSHPDDVEAYVLLAQYYLRNGRVSEAVDVSSAAKAIRPDNPSVLAVLGEAQLQAQQVSAALATVTKLVELQPNSSHARFLLATAYSETGNVKKVASELEYALRLDPENIQAKVATIRLLMLSNKGIEAEKRLDEVAKVHPDNPFVLELQALLFLGKNEYAQAISAYEKTLELLPSSLNVINLARAQWIADKHDASIDTMKTWLQTHPKDLRVQLALGNSYLGSNREEEAKQLYLKLLEQSPMNSAALNNLAWLLRDEDPVAALKYAEQAVTITNYAPEFADTLGMILLDKGEFVRAIRLFQGAASKDPANPSIAYHLALAQSKAGNSTEAATLLHKLLEARHDFDEKKDAQALLDKLEQ